MAVLRISLLGAPRIAIGGTAVVTDTRKATALLAYLAVTEQPQTRATLAALLWPESDDEGARAALRRTLSVLRTALGDRWLTTAGETISLEREGVHVDVHDFRRHIREGRDDEAVRLYHGDLLAGFALRDGDAFDAWHASQADALRADHANALSRLAESAARSERFDAAIAYAKRRLEIDPLHEPAHRALMRLYVRAGDRASALRQYHECVRVLDRELGVAPVAETKALHDAIASGRVADEEAPAAVAAAQAVGDVHTLHGDYRRAIESYESAIAKAPPSARAVLEHKLAQVHHRRGDWSNAEKHYALAHRAAQDDELRAHILADWSLATDRSGDRARARRLADDALRLAERADDRRALAQAHNILGILAGTGVAARRHLETSVALAESLDDPPAQVAALNNLALAHRRAGELDRARELTEQALARAGEIGDRHRVAALHNNLADLYRELGREEDAMRHLKRAVTLFADVGGARTSEPEVWKLVEW